ncbi:hypothetical protein QE357_004786 [Siphonobacter sp. BAB-5404]|nr:hypothetical protein [Siphonobacter sp. SORGH_AS_0500]
MYKIILLIDFSEEYSKGLLKGITRLFPGERSLDFLPHAPL